MDNKMDHINVSVRIRPLLSQDASASSSVQIISKEPPVLVVTDRAQNYYFDNIFSEDADQEKVFNEAVRPFVDCVKRGYNCTVFAYGQTGTGKTYTMGSAYQESQDQSHSGIIPRALHHLFDDESFGNDELVDIAISFAEIYNEKVFDLMQPNKHAPLSVTGFSVPDLSIKRVTSVSEANELLELGNKNRHVGETKQNSNSSRSHAIFTVYYSLNNSSQKISGKLNLVDLAGSESVKKTGSKGSTFQEGININKGLLSIGQVISALLNKQAYVPYRQSMITTILQGSLNIGNYISLIACISSSPADMTETLQTLDFAQRTKKVKSCLAKTPMKRPSGTPLKTPAAKKITLSTLPLINESVQSLLSVGDASRSRLLSSTVGSVLDTQQSFSPVIKKYVKQMEESIIDRLETVIKNSVRRPTRASLLAEKSFGKENTPNSHWNKIQSEVSKMVKNEMAQLSLMKSVKSVRAASSPIDGEEINAARRILTYDSPDTFQPLDTISPVQNSIPDVPQFSFKIPNLPLPKNKLETSNNRSKRGRKPNENTTSICKSDFDDTDASIIQDESARLEPRRRSVRIENRRSVRNAQKGVGYCCKSPLKSDGRRKSIGFNVAKTPSKSLTERALKRQTRKDKDSPFTSHSKKVLSTLNDGTQSEITKLHSVGAKTAEQILLFRKLKGNFHELEDLSKIPGWGNKKFERFIVSNMLRRD